MSWSSRHPASKVAVSNWRTPEDALRSMKRYLALALPAYDVRLAEEEGVFQRPFAMVWGTSPFAMEGPPHAIEHLQSFSVHVYPPVGAEPMESVKECFTAEAALTKAFRIGIDVGAPYRVPLYRYDGKDMATPSNTRAYCDYMSVVRGSLTLNRVRDQDDPLLYTVVMDLRVRWLRRGRVAQGAPVVAVNVVGGQP